MDAVLTDFGTQQALKPGAIVFRESLASEPSLVVRVVEGRVTNDPLYPDEQPLLELIGDARRLEQVFRGLKDGRKQFLAGGIRVRGDLQYLSDLGIRAGFLKTPIF